jgi:hypothetical protein
MTRRQVVLFAFGVIPVAIVAIAGFAATFVLDPSTGAVVTVGQSNLRSCPRLECPVVVEVPADTALDTEKRVDGDEVDGEATWHRVNWPSGDLYLHSRLATTLDEGLDRETAFNLFAVTFVVAVVAIGRSATSPQPIRDGNSSAIAYVMFCVVLALGLASGVLAFFVRSSTMSVSDYWNAVLLNLGSGLAGSAITFVLLGTLLERQARAKVSESAKELLELSAKVDRLITLQEEVPALDPRLRSTSRTMRVIAALWPRTSGVSRPR